MEMAALIVDGKQNLKERPVLSLMQCTAPPLGHDGGSLDAALRGIDLTVRRGEESRIELALPATARGDAPSAASPVRPWPRWSSAYTARPAAVAASKKVGIRSNRLLTWQ